MFYLINFYKILFKTPFKSLFFIALSMGLVVGFSQSEKLEGLVSKPQAEQNPYFYALISKRQNHRSLLRKLRDLPGIKKIVKVSQNTVRQEALRILNQSQIDLDEEMEASLGQFPYEGMKVIFSSNLQEKSQNLIRDYLVRLTGKVNVTLGAVKKYDLNPPDDRSFAPFLQKWGVGATLIFFSLISFFMGISLTRPIREQSYLIQNFQRRKLVAFKINLLGQFSLFVGGLSLSFIFGNVNYWGFPIAAIPFLLIILSQMRVHQWRP